jgi:hypothetical protein
VKIAGFKEASTKAHEIRKQLVTVLDYHEAVLADSDCMAIGVMNAQPGGFVQVALFEKIEKIEDLEN